jgi:hypothetical protein
LLDHRGDVEPRGAKLRHDGAFDTRAQAHSEVFESPEVFYNGCTRTLLNYETPDAFEGCSKASIQRVIPKSPAIF